MFMHDTCPQLHSCLYFSLVIYIQMTKKWESIEQTHDPSLGVKVEDLTSRLRDLETKSREDYKRVLENVQSTMAIFEARLHDIETQKVGSLVTR